MLCAVIIGPKIVDAYLQIVEAAAHADLYEFRLDLIEYQHISEVQQLKNLVTQPIIFTFRCNKQGGGLH